MHKSANTAQPRPVVFFPPISLETKLEMAGAASARNKNNNMTGSTTKNKSKLHQSAEIGSIARTL